NDYASHPNWGKVVRFESLMYQPHDGESIFVDNIRLSTDKVGSKPKMEYTLAGSDLVLSGTGSAECVIALGKLAKERWTPPAHNTVAQVEAEFRARYAELKKTHPKAVLAVLRDGEKGYDPARPDTVYAGWTDAYWTSHGPDTNFVERGLNKGKSASHEI